MWEEIFAAVVTKRIVEQGENAAHPDQLETIYRAAKAVETFIRAKREEGGEDEPARMDG